MAPRRALPDAWIERLFSRLEGLYGAKFHDAWRGTDLENVKAVWADKLGGFAASPERLKAALEACDERPWPPTLPEFLGLCRDAARRGDAAPLALPAPQISQEDAATRAASASALSDKLRNFAPSTAWAQKLRERYRSGEKLIDCQVRLASGALNETWSAGQCNQSSPST